MVKVQGTVTGVEGVQKSLRSIGDQARKRVREVVTAAAAMLRNHIRKSKLEGQVLKKRTGNLWESIGYVVRGDDSSVVASIFTDVRSPKNFPYGKYWEVSGSAHGGPRPFLRPALDEKRREVRQRINAAVMREAIRGAR